MLETIGNFIQFCNEENQKKLKNSILLGVVKAIFDALKIPAIACMIRALIRGKVETQDILLSFGIMLLFWTCTIKEYVIADRGWI